MLDLWYKNAVIYCIDVETFMDSDGDGIGDFQGLTDRLDHIEALGATCIWLLPFYPTPNRDNGYDVTDFYNIDPHLGTLGDFVAFRTRRGIAACASLSTSSQITPLSIIPGFRMPGAVRRRAIGIGPSGQRTSRRTSTRA